MSIERQLELETKMLSLGEEHFRESLDTTADFDSAHIQKIVKKMILPFSEILDVAIKHEMSAPRGGGPRLPLDRMSSKELHINKNTKTNKKSEKKKSPYAQPIQIAFIVVRSVFMCLRDGKRRMVTSATEVGKQINSNIITDQQFNDNECIRLGTVLIEMLVNTFPKWFITETNKDGNVSVPFTYFDKDSKWKEYVLTPSQEFVTFCDEVIEGIADISAIVYPMIHKPNDWTVEGRDGGFYSEQLKKNIIKHKHINEKSGVNADIVKSVNLIQASPWVVNNDTLSVLDELNKMDDKPESYDKAFPLIVDVNPVRVLDEKLKYADMDDEQKKIHQSWIRRVKKLTKDRQAKKSIDLAREASIVQANQFVKEDNIFFPHDLDYRNRIYNRCMTGLNTQGNDVQKGLIKFGNKRAVTTEGGVRWLQINMANLVGHDKLILNDRVTWTRDNEALLRDVVKDPIKCDIWHKWDKPLQGLASAIEYVKWLDNDQAELNLHVQLDGLCNGVQNLAAITRDEKVAPHVGLIWTPERGDVYQYVCDEVMKKISSGDVEAIAKEWIESGLIGRSLTKTPVMTRAYGSTLYGIKDGIQDYIDDKNMTEHFTDSFLAGNWMGQQIWDSMGDSLSGPMAFMEWVQTCTGILAKANKPLTWTNPVGGRCTQSPMTTKSKRIDININGKRMQYRIQTPTDKINRSKSEASSSPNVIHSCDTSHLMRTTLLCNQQGITDFAMVHDSFGCAPDDAPTLLNCAKEAWIDIYKVDHMAKWHKQWSDQLGSDDLPPPPPMGTLDITAVRKSDFFFA